MPKKSYSADIKVLAVQYLEEGRHTFEEIRTMFSVNMNTLQVWRALYKYGGVQALIRPIKNKVYSEELKRSAVEDYLTKNYSMFDILAKYGISSLSVFKYSRRALKNFIWFHLARYSTIQASNISPF